MVGDRDEGLLVVGGRVVGKLVGVDVVGKFVVGDCDEGLLVVGGRVVMKLVGVDVVGGRVVGVSVV